MTEESDKTSPRAGADGRAGHGDAQSGLCYGIAAYSLWGVFPLYFHLLRGVPPWAVLCHRIFWSALFLGLVVTVRGEWRFILPILRDRRKLLLLSAGALLIALNWFVFIYSVASRQVLESSLGYFINPLFSIALGMIFLGERLRTWHSWSRTHALSPFARTSWTLRTAGCRWSTIRVRCGTWDS